MNIPLRSGDEVVSTTYHRDNVIIVTKWGEIFIMYKCDNDDWEVKRL